MSSIGIVSSYSDSCGNAYFTKLLVASLNSDGVEATCEELDLKLTQSIDKKIRRLADEHIRTLASRLGRYDGANIQFEPGLYGSYPADIIRRIKLLVRANKNCSVTLHNARLVSDAIGQRAVIKSFLAGQVKKGIKDYLSSKKREIHININIKIIKWLCRNNVTLMVHTLRAKEQIEQFFGYKNVIVHPLQMVPVDFSSDERSYADLKRQLEFSDNDVVIGMFGFINEYKGHTQALEALELLPQNYKLLFFGRQHPQSISANQLCHPYIRKLQERILKSANLKNRVFFMGEYDTRSFMNFASCVDVLWLPYVENGQDGSGIASICVEVGKRILCSSSFAFDELFRLVEAKNVYRFDIGNSLELAQRTLFSMKCSPKISHFDGSEFSVSSQAAAYIRSVWRT